MKLVSNDIHHVLDAYNSRVRQILGPVEVFGFDLKTSVFN